MGNFGVVNPNPMSDLMLHRYQNNKTKITVIQEMTQQFDTYLFYIFKTIITMIIFSGHFKVIFHHFFLIGYHIFFGAPDREIQEESD